MNNNETLKHRHSKISASQTFEKQIHKYVESASGFNEPKYTFFYKQSIFDPRPENYLSFSKKSPQKIV